MFGSKKNTNSNGAILEVNAPSTANSMNSLGKGTKVNGDIEATSDIRVDGELRGNLNCKGKVIIGSTGYIDGTIICQNAVVEGTFKGTLTVKDLLNVKESARIDGDVKTGQLLVNSGAKFNVSCGMGGGKIDAAKGAPKLVASTKG